MKLCSNCSTEKPLSEFHRRGKGHQSICKQCRAEDDRERYQQDAERHVRVRRERRAELRAWLSHLKASNPCTDCGESFHPAAMQWDHIGTDKVVDLANAAGRGWSRNRMLTEIAKCELVCANCHAVRTWDRRQQQEQRDVA